jgi:hypothetical protein
MMYNQDANDTVYDKQVFSEKFKLMTHLFHSKLERNRRNVIMNNKEDLKDFIQSNKVLLTKIKRSIKREYRYDISNFQVNVACSFFLRKKYQNQK